MASESEEYGLSEKEVESEAFISDKEEDDGHEPEEKVEKRPRKVCLVWALKIIFKESKWE